MTRSARRLLSTVLVVLSAGSLAACEDTLAPADPAAEEFAAQIRDMPTIEIVNVFEEAQLRYTFTTGTVGIQMSDATVEGTVLVIRTTSQGTWSFALAEAKSIQVSGTSVRLHY